MSPPDALAGVVARFAAGTGPTAVDAERASGYRYSQRAYLVQLRREGAGTALVDPIAQPALHGLNAAIADAEWILHAANQDLPCLAEIGLHPSRLFDTELAGRLLGDERVAHRVAGDLAPGAVGLAPGEQIAQSGPLVLVRNALVVGRTERGARTMSRCHERLAARRRKVESRTRRPRRRTAVTVEHLLLASVCAAYLVAMAVNVLWIAAGP